MEFTTINFDFVGLTVSLFASIQFFKELSCSLKNLVFFKELSLNYVEGARCMHSYELLNCRYTAPASLAVLTEDTRSIFGMLLLPYSELASQA